MKLVLLGQIRGGKNHINITRTGHRYPNKAWAAWRDEAVGQIRRQVPVISTFKVPCRATIHYWKGDMRRRDIPAAIDAIWHVLEHAYIVADDALIVELHWLDMGLDRENARAEIELEAIP